MNLNISHAMFPTYMLFGVSLFYLVFTVWNYKRTMASGGSFAYKPLMLLFMIMAFGITTIGILKGIPFGKVVPWFG